MALTRTVLVDDAVTLRMLIRQALHCDGQFQVVAEAADGLEAIDVVAHHRPDLVLLDLAMPIMDGLEALPWIRRAAPEATVVVFTGFGEPALAGRARAAGAAGVIEKGLDATRLCQELRRTVAAIAPDGSPGVARFSASTPTAPEAREAR